MFGSIGQGHGWDPPSRILFWPKIASKRAARISSNGDLSCRELLESCRGLSPPLPQGWPFHRRGPKRTSTRESRRRKFSPTPAARATAVREKSSKPAQHFCGSTTPRVRGKRRPWLLILPRSAVIPGRFNSGVHPHRARDRRHRLGSIRPSLGMRRSRGTAAPSERSGRVVHPRAWRRAISPSLPRKEAVPRLARRKLPPRRRRGNPPAKTSRSRGSALSGAMRRFATAGSLAL